MCNHLTPHSLGTSQKMVAKKKTADVAAEAPVVVVAEAPVPVAARKFPPFPSKEAAAGMGVEALRKVLEGYVTTSAKTVNGLLAHVDKVRAARDAVVSLPEAMVSALMSEYKRVGHEAIIVGYISWWTETAAEFAKQKALIKAKPPVANPVATVITAEVPPKKPPVADPVATVIPAEVPPKKQNVQSLLDEMLQEIDSIGGEHPPKVKPIEQKKNRTEDEPPTKASRTEDGKAPKAAPNLNAIDLAEMLSDAQTLGTNRVWSIMQEVYGTEERIVVAPKLLVFLQVKPGVLRAEMKDALGQTWFAITTGLRKLLEQALEDADETADGSMVILDKPHLFEAVESLAQAWLRAEVEHWRSTPTRSFADMGHARRMEILTKYWPASAASENPSAGGGGGGRGGGRGGRGGGRGGASTVDQVKRAAFMRTGACLRCGDTAHKISGCPLPPSTKCSKCQAPGHTVKACFRK